MVVKEKVGRKRYILFRLESATISRKEFARALEKCIEGSMSGEGMEGLRLILLNGGKGILMCPHSRKDNVIAVLNGMQSAGMKVQTIRTSGTIRKLKEIIEQETCKQSRSCQ